MTTTAIPCADDRAKSDVARALEALTGRAPTPAQLAAFGEAASNHRAAGTRCPTRADPAPRARGRTFNMAGRAVADAVLVPRRTVHIPDMVDTSEPMESHQDKLTRCAGIRLAGCAAEGYATGSVFHHQPTMSIVAFSAFVLGEGRANTIQNITEDFEWCAALALRHNWPIVEAVEGRLHADRSADDILIRAARPPANDTRPARSPTQAALDSHLRRIGEGVTALALALHRAGGRA